MGNTDSRATFRQTVDVILSKIVAYEEDSFWTSLLSAKVTADDVFELITPEDVRRLRTEKPLNASTLLKRIVVVLKNVIDEASRDALTADLSIAALTCIRILTRIMPFLLENPEDATCGMMFWSPGGYLPVVQQEFKKQLSNDRETTEQIQALQKTPDEQKESDKMIAAIEILTCLQRLLFLNEFCVKAKGVKLSENETLQKNNVDTRFLWKGGIGTSKEMIHSHTSQILKNRCEVLRCLLCCLSGSLFYTIDDYQQTPPVWIQTCTHGNLPYTANMFCSLMSTVFTYDPVGYGVPYGSVFSGNEEEELVSISLQVLCILMDFNPMIFAESNVAGNAPTHHQMSQTSVDPTAPHTQSDAQTPTHVSASPSATYARASTHGSEDLSNISAYDKSNAQKIDEDSNKIRNVYREMLQKIHKDSEIDTIQTGFITLLSTIPQSRNTYLPNSASPVQYHQELLILLWHLITTNQVFLRRITSRPNSNKLVVPLLFLLMDSSNARADKTNGPSKIGLLHMCSFLLLVLSSERDFAVHLNEPFTDTFPLDVPYFMGCHADLLVIVTYRVIVDCTSSRTNDSLIDMLLTMLSNISAYVKSFCLESCVRLLNLLDRFTRPSWLFKMPYHYHDVFFLLDLLNNLIQYQYEGNKQLVYSILRQKDLFRNLQNLQFPSKTTQKNIELNEQNGETTPAHTNTHSQTQSDVPTSAQKDTTGAQTPYKPNEPPQLESTQSFSNEQWVPTPQWFNDWKSKLPIQTITRLIRCLLPVVEAECLEKGIIDQSEVMQFLNKTTMVGLLPVPHPIIIRNYHPNAYTALWFTSYMWGVIFSRSQSLAIFDWRQIRLIVINPANN